MKIVIIINSANSKLDPEDHVDPRIKGHTTEFAKELHNEKVRERKEYMLKLYKLKNLLFYKNILSKIKNSMMTKS